MYPPLPSGANIRTIGAFAVAALIGSFLLSRLISYVLR
jgi:hypothetical protein